LKVRCRGDTDQGDEKPNASKINGGGDLGVCTLEEDATPPWEKEGVIAWTPPSKQEGKGFGGAAGYDSSEQSSHKTEVDEDGGTDGGGSRQAVS